LNAAIAFFRVAAYTLLSIDGGKYRSVIVQSGLPAQWRDKYALDAAAIIA